MAKGQAGKADSQLKTTNSVAAGAGNKAGGLMSSIDPFYKGEMTNPQGFGQQDLSNMLTLSNQALGGATSGITGQGALNAARTRNSAGITTALDDTSRHAMQQESENAAGIGVENAKLKEQQRQEGAAGEAGLFNTETGLEGQMYGMGAPTLNARAAGGSWMQNTFSPFMSAIGFGGGKLGGMQV